MILTHSSGHSKSTDQPFWIGEPEQLFFKPISLYAHGLWIIPKLQETN